MFLKGAISKTCIALQENDHNTSASRCRINQPDSDPIPDSINNRGLGDYFAMS